MFIQFRPYISIERRMFVVLTPLVVLGFVSIGMMAETPDSSHPITALEARALCIAFGAFRSEAPTADLKHYSVSIDRIDKDFDVAFIPEASRKNPGLIGGETEFGAEIHYIVSYRTGKIIRKHFAR